jgi:hypothetical protein
LRYRDDGAAPTGKDSKDGKDKKDEPPRRKS